MGPISSPTKAVFDFTKDETRSWKPGLQLQKKMLALVEHSLDLGTPVTVAVVEARLVLGTPETKQI